MTDKEQIIIDGVDVSGCEYLKPYNYGTQFSCCCDNSKPSTPTRITGRGGCMYNLNCYYKQLARKTQECEELKERASIAEDNFACEVQTRLYHQNEWLKFSEENDRYLKALEEIEEILDNGTANININAAHLVHQHYLARFCDIRNIISNAKAITT